MKRASPDFQMIAGERSLTLRFSTKALAAMQDHWGCKTLNEVGAKLEGLEGEDTTLDDFAAILWAALRTHHPAITKDEAYDLLDDMGLAYFQTVMMEAMAGSSSSGASEGGGGDASAPPRKRGRSNAS